MRIANQFLAAALALTCAWCACADDWPQWRGPRRDAVSRETGLARAWPEGGPTLAWCVEGLGEGFSQAAVANGRIYVTGMVGETGILSAFDLKGRLLWKREYGGEWKNPHPGSRSTPTVDGDRVYLMSGLGRVVCFDAASGEQKWAREAREDFKGHPLDYGNAESLLVEGGNVICTPGGPDAGVVALARDTGRTVWTSKGFDEMAAYCSPLCIEQGGRCIIVTMTSLTVVGVDAKTGAVLWKHRHKESYDKAKGDNIHANTPLFDRGDLFVTSGYGITGAEMLRLSPDGTGITKVWAEKKVDTHHGGVVLVDGRIYGTSHNGKWLCLDWKTGAILQEGPGVGKGSVAGADGMLYGYGENGVVALMKPTPQGFETVSQFKIPKGTREHWAHPVVSGGRLYIRHGDALLAYDVREHGDSVSGTPKE